MKPLRAAAVAVMAAASLFSAAAPAQAADDPSPVSWWIESQVNLGCLGSTGTSSESTRQGWIHDPIGNGLVQIRNKATGQCLDTNVAGVYTSPCGNVADIGIKWRIKRVFGG